MPKAATITPHTRDCRTDRRQVPTSGRYTSVRALHSIYSQKSGAVGAGKGGPVEPAVAAGAALFPARGSGHSAQVPLPHVWNCNKPKTVKNYNVYAKQPPASVGRKAAKTVREWVHPPYPAKRPKVNKNRSERPRNYETFYVSFGDNGRSQPTDEGPIVALDNQEMPQSRNPDLLREVEAKRRLCFINRWNQQEASKEVLEEKHDHEQEQSFPCLPPAGVRYALRLQTEIDQMASLIAEVKEIRQQQLSAEGEPKPPQLLRSRTQTLFSISDCHPVLYEYARRLPFVPSPRDPKAVHSRSLPEI